MPVYHYICSNNQCSYDQEVFHSIHEKIRQECPECKEQTLKISIDTIPYGKVKNITTLGQLAEENSKKMGKELVEKRMDADGTKERMQVTENHNLTMKRANLTPEKREKYIMTGKL